MSWIEILGLGILGGLICGGFFFALGLLLDWLDNRAYEKALAEAVEASPSEGRSVVITSSETRLFIPNQRDGGDDA